MSEDKSASGGVLVDAVLPEKEKEALIASASVYPRLILDEEQVKDVKNIALGVYSPLTGFMRRDDFEAVLDQMRLAGGSIWPIPIVLDITAEQKDELSGQDEVLLVDAAGTPVGLLKNPEIYEYEKEAYAEKVFGTTETKHPGVASVYRSGDYLIGGDVVLLDTSKSPFPQHYFTPKETRRMFADRGWETIAAFQTRNVPHRGHEFLQKKALEEVDGLFIQPVVGEKKLEDFKDEYVIAAYEVLIGTYYPRERVLLGILPLKMRYAGPREALLHALIRRNYGCTHFVVGRDHAGVGDYYPPFAAQEIFSRFEREEIGIDILKFEEVVYCPHRRRHLFYSECAEGEKVTFSSTLLRDMIKKGQRPPEYLMRPEVYELLANSDNTLVDDDYHMKAKGRPGLVLWFTGLSQSGKSTIADMVYEILKQKGLRVERLDGDLVRQSLTRDLGFSKEDRDENIRRVRFVAKLLSQNGVAVVASFISPYRRQRKRLREETQNFIEVFVNTPLEICEKRDRKELYAKARRGEIKNFTGISDPYEEPEDPEIELKPAQQTADECADRVIAYLKEEGFLDD
jgi:sulfate adenylyltransferase